MFHQHASPSTSHLWLANQCIYYYTAARKVSWWLTLKSVHVYMHRFYSMLLLLLSKGMRQLKAVGGVLPWKYHAHN